jgi:hypothetical protein
MILESLDGLLRQVALVIVGGTSWNVILFRWMVSLKSWEHLLSNMWSLGTMPAVLSWSIKV